MRVSIFSSFKSNICQNSYFLLNFFKNIFYLLYTHSNQHNFKYRIFNQPEKAVQYNCKQEEPGPSAKWVKFICCINIISGQQNLLKFFFCIKPHLNYRIQSNFQNWICKTVHKLFNRSKIVFISFQENC